MINGGIWGVKFPLGEAEIPSPSKDWTWGKPPLSFAPFLTIVQVRTVYSRIFPR
jgi:hypothetical protein